jgi:hypothetical protein
MTGIFTRLKKLISGADSAFKWGNHVWALISFLGLSGLLATWVASSATWISGWGPFGWLVAGLAVSFVLALISLMAALVVERLAKANLYRIYERREGHTSPLKNNYENEVINLVDFYVPWGMFYKNKTFRNCAILGPATLACKGNLSSQVIFTNCREEQCKHVEAYSELDDFSVMIFEDSRFIDCIFHRVCFISGSKPV